MNTTSNHEPKWIIDRTLRKNKSSQLYEIEVKYILPRQSLLYVIENEITKKQQLSQTYLSKLLGNQYVNNIFEDPIPDEIELKEWRIRQIDDSYYFTVKGKASARGTKRFEKERLITEKQYHEIKKQCDKTNNSSDSIGKIRYSYNTNFANIKVLVQIDDYKVVKGVRINKDFVVCEIEVPSVEIADVFQKGRFYCPSINYLHKGINVTGIKQFSNRFVSVNGLVGNSYSEIQEWIKNHYLGEIEQYVSSLRDNLSSDIIKEAEDKIQKIKILRNAQILKYENREATIIPQDILTDVAFKPSDSWGRKKKTDENLKNLDMIGKGWLRDYHEIISSDFYIRLNYKPQIFRPGLKYTNTTTRGAHTSDVIALSIQLSRQLGLNSELSMAIAAMHDIGHASGGHIGEKTLFKLSGRKFYHHIFSVSLADIFGLNLLSEVLVGAFYHKSAGKNLATPKGKPHEFGICRIADKLSYTPWDIFDSIKNGFLNKSDVSNDIFDTLGDNPMEWIHTLEKAVIQESAEAHSVSFSEKSGEVFEAFRAARKTVYDKVHKEIYWAILCTQMEICYEKIVQSFPRIDPVPVIAYMTDNELELLTKQIECNPLKMKLNIKELKHLGFGFVEIIEIMKDKDFDDSNIFYNNDEKIQLIKEKI